MNVFLLGELDFILFFAFESTVAGIKMYRIYTINAKISIDPPTLTKPPTLTHLANFKDILGDLWAAQG